MVCLPNRCWVAEIQLPILFKADLLSALVQPRYRGHGMWTHYLANSGDCSASALKSTSSRYRFRDDFISLSDTRLFRSMSADWIVQSWADVIGLMKYPRSSVLGVALFRSRTKDAAPSTLRR